MLEEDLNLDELDAIEQSAENKLKVKNRFQTLSEKVKIEAQEREKAEAQLKAESEARSTAERERDFFKDFSTKASKYPGASEHQDAIWERVQKGYDTEDAMLAVLAKEGKLNTMQPNQQTQQVSAEGGSAATNVNTTRSTDLGAMSLQEKEAALMQLEKEGGIQLT